MADLVDRQAAIDRVNDIVDVNHLREDLVWFTPIGVKALIEEQPSAQRWIPCSERLPEKSGEYIVFLQAPTDYCEEQKDWSTVTCLRFDWEQKMWIGGCSTFYNAILSVVEKDADYHVSAWMPLPEPYKEGEENA